MIYTKGVWEFGHINNLQIRRIEEFPDPILIPLGDHGLLIRFGVELEEKTNERAVAIAEALSSLELHGVLEICPTLVSVFVRYDPQKTSFMGLSNQVRLALVEQETRAPGDVVSHKVQVSYGGEFGPDLENVAADLDMEVETFIDAHNQSSLRVLAVGFAPGFVYCGLHKLALHLPRRQKLHTKVATGSIIFAAGQTAITATNVPTGWHVIGQTDLRNFQPDRTLPLTLQAGDKVSFTGRRVD